MNTSQSTMNSSMNQDISRSVDQLCAQLSISNISNISNMTVPRLDTSKDVFEFISEFEMATAMLPDTQRAKLLVKSFPPGRLGSWFESELKPLVETKSWSAIKTKIIERYSDTEDCDRHLRRLETLKFNPDGKSKLFDYVEDLLYSFSKSFPLEKEETKIRYAKSKLPLVILPVLSNIPNYHSNDLKPFLKALRQYDILKAGCPSAQESQSDTTKVTDLVKALKDLFEGMRQQQTPHNVVSAIGSRSQSPVRPSQREVADQSYRRREDSPRRVSYHRYQERPPSPYYSRTNQRTPSPNRNSVHQNNYYPQHNNQYYPNQPYYPTQNNYPVRQQNPITYDNQSTNYSRERQYQRDLSPGPRNYRPNENRMQNEDVANRSRPALPVNNKQINAFDNARYFEKFGMPPSPCSNCQMMHWTRHCLDYLN